MTEDPPTVPVRTLGFVVAAACGVVIWKVTALLIVFMQDAGSSEDSILIKALLAVLGLVFVACGLLVFWKMPSKTNLLFAGFCLCAGLHWGGPFELPSGPLRTGFLVFYFLISSLLGEIYFLRFALRFRKESQLAHRRSTIWVLYAPLIAATALAAVYLVAPPASSLAATSQQSLFLIVSVVGNLFAVIGLVFFVSYFFRVGLNRAQKMWLGLMVVGMLTAWLPYLVAENLGVDTAPWTLTFAALPVAFAIGLFGIERARQPGGSSVNGAA